MTTKEQVEAEAQDRYNAGKPWSSRTETAQAHAFIAGRTVGRERYVEAARKTGISTYEAREFLYAAGLLIEGHQP